MAHCPGSTADGCRCPEHHPGLAEYARDPAAFLAALERLHVGTDRAPRADATALRLVEDPCKGGMLCDCKACTAERQAATRRQRAGATRQPWEPRPPRHLRAA